VKLGARRGPGPRGYPVLTRRTTRAEPTDDGPELARAAIALLERMPDAPVRLVGVGASGLVPAARTGGGAGSGRRGPVQVGLFEPPEARRRTARLNRALDALADRFGSRAVVRGGREQAARAGLSLQRKRGERGPDEDGEG